jgi:hypothetical protein
MFHAFFLVSFDSAVMSDFGLFALGSRFVARRNKRQVGTTRADTRHFHPTRESESYLCTASGRIDIAASVSLRRPLCFSDVLFLSVFAVFVGKMPRKSGCSRGWSGSGGNPIKCSFRAFPMFPL